MPEPTFTDTLHWLLDRINHDQLPAPSAATIGSGSWFNLSVHTDVDLAQWAEYLHAAPGPVTMKHGGTYLRVEGRVDGWGVWVLSDEPQPAPAAEQVPA
jgi:hypothetical protein